MFLKSKLLLLLSIFYLGILGCASEELTSARLYIQQENWEKAEEFLIKALDVEPDNPEIPYLLGKMIYAKKKDWGKMNEMFDLALGIDEDKVILEGATVGEYVDQARSQFWIDKFNTGVNKFNKFRKSSGDERKTALDNAILSFKEAIHINPGEPQTYPILATCFYESGNNDLAKDYASKGAVLAASNFDANFTAGQIFSSLEDKEGAISYFIKAVEIDPTSGSAIRYLAQAYYDLGQKEKSIETYQSAIKNETDLKVKADLHFNLGVLFMQVNRFTDAEDNFMMAYDMNPDDVEALVGMAQTFETAEKWSRAEKFYRELIFLEPDNSKHYRGMSRVLLRQGKKDESDYYLNKSKMVGS